MPSVPNGGITVAAVSGDAFYPPYAVAYRDHLVGGQSGVTFTIPKPASNLSVNTAGLAKWTPASSSPVSVLHIVADQFYEDYYIVTTGKQEGFPSEAETGIAAPHARDYSYSIQTHGAYATVDDATKSPNGFLEPFQGGEPRGTVARLRARTRRPAAAGLHVALSVAGGPWCEPRVLSSFPKREGLFDLARFDHGRVDDRRFASFFESLERCRRGATGGSLRPTGLHPRPFDRCHRREPG